MKKEKKEFILQYITDVHFFSLSTLNISDYITTIIEDVKFEFSEPNENEWKKVRTMPYVFVQNVTIKHQTSNIKYEVNRIEEIRFLQLSHMTLCMMIWTNLTHWERRINNAHWMNNFCFFLCEDFLNREVF